MEVFRRVWPRILTKRMLEVFKTHKKGLLKSSHSQFTMEGRSWVCPYEQACGGHVGTECPICGVDETLDHLFVYCERLGGLLGCLGEWCGRSGEIFLS